MSDKAQSSKEQSGSVSHDPSDPSLQNDSTSSSGSLMEGSSSH